MEIKKIKKAKIKKIKNVLFGKYVIMLSKIENNF